MDLSVILTTIVYVFITYSTLKKCVVIVNLTEIKVCLYIVFFSSKLGLLCINVEDCYGVSDPDNFNS